MNTIEESGYISTVKLIDGETLTGTFADTVSEATRISPLAQVEVLLDYTMGAAETSNTCTVKVELSESKDGPWREPSIAGDAAPANGVVLSTLYNRRLAIVGETAGVATSRWFAFPTSAKYLKLSAIEEGVAVNYGTLTAKLRLSNGLRTD